MCVSSRLRQPTLPLSAGRWRGDVYGGKIKSRIYNIRARIPGHRYTVRLGLMLGVAEWYIAGRGALRYFPLLARWSATSQPSTPARCQGDWCRHTDAEKPGNARARGKPTRHQVLHLFTVCTRVRRRRRSQSRVVCARVCRRRSAVFARRRRVRSPARRLLIREYDFWIFFSCSPFSRVFHSGVCFVGHP